MRSGLLILLTWLLASTARAGPPTVVLDPGHGPASPGAVSARGVPEVTFNDRLAAAVAGHLGEDVRVVLTRKPEEQIGWPERLSRIQEADPDLVISIHHDSVQPQFLTTWKHEGEQRRHCDRFGGFSLFVPTRGYHAEISLLAARSIGDRLLSAKLSFTRHHAMKITGESRSWVDETRGIHAGDFLHLLRNARRPVVLMEAGVLVHRDEERRLADPDEIDRLAGLVAEGVRGFFSALESERRGVEPVPPRSNDAAIQHPRELPSTPVIRWQVPLPGLEFALVPVHFRGSFVDRLVLVRANPSRFRVRVLFDSEPKDIGSWRRQLGATVVFNSSFYNSDPLEPNTPILLQGERRGPKSYHSRHGAFLAEPRQAGKPLAVIRDYDGERVDLEGSGYLEGVVSYPMLVDGRGKVRAAPNPQWRADRTFVATDRRGMLVVGVTEGGFFSLNRLGRFLQVVPDLELDHVLNLDGGPPACLAIRAGALEYLAQGRWESNDSVGREIFFWGAREVSWPLPGVIALFPRE